MATQENTGAPAPSQHPPACTTPDQSATELQVIIRLDLDFSEYHGTRAQLEAEDVIPEGTEWPNGSRDVHWKAGRLECSLRRIRPDDLKGPMSLWVTGDWWSLRFELIDKPDFGARKIQRKAAELAAAVYDGSIEGQVQHHADWRRYWAARQDKHFRAFKVLVVGLVPPKLASRWLTH